MSAVPLTARLLLRHPAHAIALGFGSGLVPRVPGTAGTVLGWVSFVLLDPLLGDTAWAVSILAGCALGVWACTVTARHLQVADPGAIVWDEIVAFWIVLWLLMPAGQLAQAGAFVLFRYFDTVKPGPVRWADGLFKLRPGQAIGWRQGVGILLDDLVAALCTLVVIALWITAWRW